MLARIIVLYYVIFFWHVFLYCSKYTLLFFRMKRASGVSHSLPESYKNLIVPVNQVFRLRRPGGIFPPALS